MLEQRDKEHDTFLLAVWSSEQSLIQALYQYVARQINADEHHFAHALFARGPGRAEVAAHELVHALENHLALGAIHVEYTFVTQHARPIDLHDGAQKIFQLGRVEWPAGAIDEALDIVVVMVVVRSSVAVLM